MADEGDDASGDVYESAAAWFAVAAAALRPKIRCRIQNGSHAVAVVLRQAELFAGLRKSCAHLCVASVVAHSVVADRSMRS